MNIYLLSQSVNNGYYTYDSCVVIAEDEDKAQCMHPDSDYVWEQVRWCMRERDHSVSHQWVSSAWVSHQWASSTWVSDIKDVKVEFIGMAGGKNEKGKPSLITPRVVCASFNAG